MLRRTFIAGLLTLAFLCVPSQAAPPAAKSGLEPSRLSLISPRLKTFVDKGEIAGAVTLIARHGEIAHLDAIGWQDIENRKPMRSDSIFQIMSMTKPLTGLAIMMLMEEGKLTLNDPIELHLPEFHDLKMADGSRPNRPITIRDVMTHTSGMSSNLPPSMPDLYTKMDRTLKDALTEFAKQPLEFQPGSKWQYSNSGIAALGRIVEVLSDMPYERFMQERIFNPLGMKDSFYFLPADRRDRLAVLYTRKDGKLVKADASNLGGDSTAFRPGAKYSAPEFGLYTTASDLAAFYQMMLNGGTYNDQRFLSKASVDVMTQLQTGALEAGHNPGCGFGLTWEVVKDQTGSLSLLSPGTYKHGGAFGTHGWVDPKKDLIGVFLIQTTNDDKRARDAFMQIAGSAVVD